MQLLVGAVGMERKMNSSVGLCLALEPEMETKVELTRLNRLGGMLKTFARRGFTFGSCWKKVRILYQSESCSRVFPLWGLPPPKIKSRVTLCKIKRTNIKYETGPSGGRAPRTRAREDQTEGLPFLLVCLSYLCFQVPRPPDIPIVLLLLFPKQEAISFT